MKKHKPEDTVLFKYNSEYNDIELHRIRSISCKGYLQHNNSRYFLANYRQVVRCRDSLKLLKKIVQENHRSKSIFDHLDERFFRVLTLIYVEERERNLVTLGRELDRIESHYKSIDTRDE